MSTIALTSVRPIRPPAPATTSRISAIGLTPGTRGEDIARRDGKGTTAAAVVAFEDDDFANTFADAQRLGLLIFGRAVTGQRRLIARKFDHHDARAQLAFYRFGFAGAGEKSRTEFV